MKETKLFMIFFVFLILIIPVFGVDKCWVYNSKLKQWVDVDGGMCNPENPAFVLSATKPTSPPSSVVATPFGTGTTTSGGTATGSSLDWLSSQLAAYKAVRRSQLMGQYVACFASYNPSHCQSVATALESEYGSEDPTLKGVAVLMSQVQTNLAPPPSTPSVVTSASPTDGGGTSAAAPVPSTGDASVDGPAGVLPDARGKEAPFSRESLETAAKKSSSTSSKPAARARQKAKQKSAAKKAAAVALPDPLKNIFCPKQVAAK